MGEEKKKKSVGELINGDSKGAKKPDKKEGVKYKKSSVWIKVGIAVVLVVLIGVLALMISNGNLEEGADEVVYEITVDDTSKDTLTFINDQRLGDEVDALIFVPELYPVLVEMSEQKSSDPMAYRDPNAAIQQIKDASGVEETDYSYAKIIEIEGKGVQEAKSKLGRVFLYPSPITDSNYVYGAVGCDENYCTIALFDEWNPII